MPVRIGFFHFATLPAFPARRLCRRQRRLPVQDQSVIGGFYHVQIMFDDDDRIARINQTL
jgi:hypothetical protein